MDWNSVSAGVHAEIQSLHGFGVVEVVEGLRAGDTVVTAGNAQLADGAKVEVVASAAAAGE